MNLKLETKCHFKLKVWTTFTTDCPTDFVVRRLGVVRPA